MRAYVRLQTIDEIKKAMIANGPVNFAFYDAKDQLGKCYCLVGYNESGFLLSDGVCGLTYDVVQRAIEKGQFEATQAGEVSAAMSGYDRFERHGGRARCLHRLLCRLGIHYWSVGWATMSGKILECEICRAQKQFT